VTKEINSHTVETVYLTVSAVAVFRERDSYFIGNFSDLDAVKEHFEFDRNNKVEVFGGNAD
jgi:hypothetical protein